VGNLPGKPDIAHKGKKKAIFVHGCFWHFHETCDRGTLPKRNRAFWREKLEGNRIRDERNKCELMEAGFDVLVVWECELKDRIVLSCRLEDFWKPTSIQD
jgi:DNA mismatch endonuclease (patch repair protein)